MISSLSLKLYLNSLVYHRNIFGSSSKVFGNLRIFSETVWERSSGLRNNFVNFRKSSENHQKRRHEYVYTIKRPLHVSSRIRILCSRVKNNISLVRYCSCHSNIKFISSRHCVISSIYAFPEVNTLVT